MATRQKEYVEGKGDSGSQTQGSKSIDSLRKLLLRNEPSEKSDYHDEICSSLSEVVKSVSSAVHKPSSSQVISQAIEIFLLACSDQNHRVRSSASENLKRLVKELMGSHFARVQLDLFHELKKNGETRSLCVALECFSSLFPFTRPSKCSVYAQSLVPVLLRLIGREEESLHDALQDAFLKILPTLTPFMAIANIKIIADGLINHLKEASASYRRMVSTALGAMVKFSRQSLSLLEWLLDRLFTLGCNEKANSEVVSGVLMTLQQLFLFRNFPFILLKQAYCYVISCLLYRSGSTDLSALECLHQLLKCTNAEFMIWLSSPQSDHQIAVEFWCCNIDSGERSEAVSLNEDLDTPLDDYFESDQGDEGPTAQLEVPIQAQSKPFASAISDKNCLALSNGSTEPLRNVFEFVVTTTLSSARVSAQSLGLACVTAAIEINPHVMTSLESIATFLVAQDPKLRSGVTKLLATIILAQLRFYHGNFADCQSVVTVAYEHLLQFINDHTPIVLKSVCESLRLCLPALSVSTQPARVVDIVRRLLPLGEISYWLTKVELLQTLSCLDYTVLALFDAKISEVILNHVIFKLIGDSDFRVRAMACQCLVSLASTLTLDGSPLLAHLKTKSGKLFAHFLSTNIEFSFAGIADTLVKPTILPPIGLNHILWFLLGSISSCADITIQKGSLEALHLLSIHYPPASLPSQWGCHQQPCTVIAILLDLLESSNLGWSVQAQSELLELCGSIFLSCGVSNMQRESQTNSAWGALKDSTLINFAANFLSHNIRLLSVFVHVIEQREPENRDKKLQLGVSPKKQANVDVLSPGKSKPSQIIQESLNLKPPIVPKDGMGYFGNLPHFMKLFDACKAAYVNFQVSLDPVGTDKFSHLLQICHNSLATLFEIALANDVGRYVEEILLYIGFTVRIDHCGALLCVQQLLNALFGMNIAAQHTHLYSPFLSSLPFTISCPQFVDLELDFYGIAVSNPVDLMKKWLEVSPSISTSAVSGEERSFIPIRKALVMKPVNSASDIKDYIAYFEPLVVYALNQFPYTSSLLLQQRVLFLIVQLMHLKVRYDLLDCHHSFYESVKKLIGVMETGMVKGGEALVPHLFQFLVLLASDQSKILTIPQVIQMCDGVMASGHNVTTFAIPALQPLVLNLFVRSTRLSPDIDIQREVALNMLLRLIEHPRVIVLLTHVLDFYKRKKEVYWQEVSNKIYAALLPQVGKLNVVLDNNEALLALYQLLMTMAPKTVTFSSVLAAILKPTVLTSATQLLRWLAMLSVLLELMVSLFSEPVVSSSSSFQFHVPEFKSPLAVVSKQGLLSSENNFLTLASFVHHSIVLAVKTLHQVCVQKCAEEYKFLPTLISNTIVLLQILLEDGVNFKAAFSLIQDYTELTECFLSLCGYFPLLTLHYINFMLLVEPASTDWVESVLQTEHTSSSSILVQYGAIASICAKHTANMKSLLLSIAKSPALLLHRELKLTGDFLKCVNHNPEAIGFLFNQLRLTGDEPALLLQQYLDIASNALSSEALKFLCTQLIPHSLSVISQAANSIAIKLIDDPNVQIGLELAMELLENIQPFQERCPELVSKLCSISGQSKLDSLLTSQFSWNLEGDIDQLGTNKEFCLKMIKFFCSAADTSRDREVCSRILSVLEKEDLDIFFLEAKIPLSLLENCIVHGVWLSLSFKGSLEYTTSVEQRAEPKDNIHPLFEVSVKHLLSRFKEDPLNCDLTRCFVRLLAAIHQFPRECLLTAESMNSLRIFCLHTLKLAYEGHSPLDIQNSLDCCTLALHLPEVQDGITLHWAVSAVTILYHLVKSVYPIKLPKLEVGHSSHGEADLNHAKDQLLAILSVLLNRGLIPTPYTLHGSLKSLTFTLCRLSIWHGSLITPPVLKGEGVISYKILDEALMESEVLLEYMQRCNSLGWLTRFQYEERWMQLLGVINQPTPSEESSVEECHAYYLNVCSGLQAITSLLLATTLRPQMGNPTSSIPMNVHRINEMLFLGSRPGRKLAGVRKRLEHEILLECGARTDIYSYYQNPLLNHYSSCLYPPLYTRNIEKEVGDTSVGYGQLSLSSLWSILFKQTSPGYHSDSEEIDVKSCVLSLIDLYIHWLRQPVNTVLLNHVLQSVIMLSDLFAVSSQFQWMLETLLDLYEHHPHEDTPTMSLIVVGILKITAVLKSETCDVERAVKVIDKSLSSDFLLQTACIRGVLYLSEEPSSAVMPACIQTVTKYAVTCFQSFHSYTEDHLMVLWSLTIKIITDHGQNLKDQSFTSCVLDVITRIMMDPTISTAFFHSISVGLEVLVLNFSLSAEEKTAVISSASSRFIKSDQNKSVIALSLLLTCMYTGEEADIASGLAETSFNPMETAIQAREQVNNLMERLRHGPEANITFIVDVLPKIITDFLPPMEVLQTVVTDFVSPHQSRPRFSASIMAETFKLLFANGHEAVLTEWILLSLDSFVQQEPEAKAVWSLTCLLLAASNSDLHHLLLLCVCHWKNIGDPLALQLLCVAAKCFYLNKCDDQKQGTMIRKFKESRYSSLLQVAQYCSSV